MKETKYSLQKIESVTSFMRQFGFSYIEIAEYDGDFLARMTMTYTHFDIRISYAFKEHHLLIWFAGAAATEYQSVYSGPFPNNLENSEDLKLFIDAKVKKIFN